VDISKIRRQYHAAVQEEEMNKRKAEKNTGQTKSAA